MILKVLFFAGAGVNLRLRFPTYHSFVICIIPGIDFYLYSKYVVFPFLRNIQYPIIPGGGGQVEGREQSGRLSLAPPSGPPPPVRSPAPALARPSEWGGSAQRGHGAVKQLDEVLQT